MINDDRPVQDADDAQHGVCHGGNQRLRDSPSVHLGLGSNLGDREANLREAIARCQRLGLKIVRASSIYETEPVGYQAQPWFLNQVVEARMPPTLMFDTDEEYATLIAKVFNLMGAETDEACQPEAAAKLFQSLYAARPSVQVNALLYALLGIESEMGRKRTMPNGPRVIDIDILLYGEMRGSYCKPHGASENPFITAAQPLYLIIPHPRMHERRFVLTPLCEIAPALIPPGMQQTCCEMLAALDDPSVVRVYKSDPSG